MTTNEKKAFIINCIDFYQSCNANKVPCDLKIGPRYIRVICKPQKKFEEHFEYDMNDSLELCQESLMSDVEYMIEDHFKL